MNPATDAQLIAWLDAIAREDRAALRALYDACAPRLMGVAMRVLGARELAEDALQEGFVTIWRTAGSYRASLSPPMAWLGLVVRSRALDMLRRRGTDGAVRAGAEGDAALAVLESDDAWPIDAAEASEQATALHQCLSRIAPRERAVVTLAYFRDLSQSEIARTLALPLGTVKTWMRRSLEQLRTCMDRFA